MHYTPYLSPSPNERQFISQQLKCKDALTGTQDKMIAGIVCFLIQKQTKKVHVQRPPVATVQTYTSVYL